MKIYKGRKLSTKEKISNSIFLLALLWLFLGFKYPNHDYFFLVTGFLVIILRLQISDFILRIEGKRQKRA